MDKNQFFDNLHIELGKKYNLDPRTIDMIRGTTHTKEATIQFLQNQIKLRQLLIERLGKSIELRKVKRLINPHHIETNLKKIEGIKSNIREVSISIDKIKKYLQKISLLPVSAWQDITQKTKFDKT